MSAYEMMLSESQERMLMVLKPEKEEEAEAIFRKWGLDFAVVGKTTPSKRFIVRHQAARSWPTCRSRNSATRRRYTTGPSMRRRSRRRSTPAIGRAADEHADALVKLLGRARPLLASAGSGSNTTTSSSATPCSGRAATPRVVRVEDGPKGLALTTDVTPRYCEADPFEGGKQAVAEGWRNLTAVGARPLAVTDNLNFGNPERPEIMGQFVGCVRGIARSLPGARFPGRVRQRLALQRDQRPGDPADARPSAASACSTISRNRRRSPSSAEARRSCWSARRTGWLGQSLYLREICGREEGAPPPVDLAAEKRNGDFVRALIGEGAVERRARPLRRRPAVALAEMAMASGIGAALEPRRAVPAHAFWFGEDQARYVVTVPAAQADAVLARAPERPACRCARLGMTGGDALTLPGERPILVARLRERFEGWLPAYMAGEL